VKLGIAFLFIVSSSLWAGPQVHRAGSIGATIHAAYLFGQKIVEKAMSASQPVAKTVLQRIREIRELLLEANKDPLRNIDQIRDLEDELAELSDPNYQGSAEESSSEAETQEQVVSTKHRVSGAVPGLWNAMGTPMKGSRPDSSDSDSVREKTVVNLFSSSDDEEEYRRGGSVSSSAAAASSASSFASQGLSAASSTSNSTPKGSSFDESATSSLTPRAARCAHENPLQAWKRLFEKACLITKGSGTLVLSPKHWVEAASPRHPYVGSNEIAGLMARWRQDPNSRSLERILDRQPSVQYLTPEERENFRIQMVDNVLVQGNRALSSGNWMFVIGPDAQLYVGRHEEGHFHHSSFFGGGTLIWAGEFEIDAEGRIRAISDQSGHYQPKKEDNIRGLSVLGQLGINLSGVYFKQEWRPGCDFDTLERRMPIAEYIKQYSPEQSDAQ
jgi:hypothetical protein